MHLTGTAPEDSLTKITVPLSNAISNNPVDKGKLVNGHNMTRQPVKRRLVKGQAFKGQGVIEYAGALVTAAAIIAVALVVGPPNMANVFSQLSTEIGTMFTSGMVQMSP
jgi:hypothetical protein